MNKALNYLTSAIEQATKSVKLWLSQLSTNKKEVLKKSIQL